MPLMQSKIDTIPLIQAILRLLESPICNILLNPILRLQRKNTEKFATICRGSLLPADLNQLTDQLTEWTEDWCREVAVSCIEAQLVEDVPDFDLSQHGYVGDLVTKLARDFIDSTRRHFDETITLIRVYKHAEPILPLLFMYQQFADVCNKTVSRQLHFRQKFEGGFLKHYRWQPRYPL